MSASSSSSGAGATIIVAGLLLGAALGTGRTGVAIGALGFLGLLLLFGLSPRNLVFAVLVFAVTPALRGIPLSVVVGGRAVYFTDLLLPLAAIWSLCSPAGGSRQLARSASLPQRPLGAALYVFIAGISASLLVGLSNSNDTSLILRDIRGPLYVVCGYVTVVRASRPDDRRTAFTAISVIIWTTALLVILESVAGIQLLGGRVEDVSRVENGASNAALDATRFILGPTNIALFVVCVSAVTVICGRRPSTGWLRWVGTLVLPSMILVFFSFSRRSLLAVGISVAIGVVLRPNARSAVRLATLAVVGLASLLVAGGLLSGSDSYLSRQVTAFQDRVLTGLSGDSRSKDLGIQWRQTENQYASRSFEKSPLVGHGFGATYRPNLRGQPFFGTERLYGRAYVHNFYYWWLVKGGILGVVTFMLLLFSGVKRGLRLARLTGDLTYFAFAVALIGLVSVNFIAPVFNEVPTATFLGCLLGWLQACGKDAIPTDPLTSGATGLSRRTLVP